MRRFFFGLVYLLSSKAVKKTCKIKNVSIFGKFKIFLAWLKESTHSKDNYVKTFNFRHNAKQYRVSQGTVG